MTNRSGQKLTQSQRVALAQQVKVARVERGLTQAELAEAAGVSRQTVSNMETGQRAPQESALRKLMDVLGIELSEDVLSEDTRLWVGLIGGMLEALPEQRRARAGKAALDAATAELLSNVSGSEHSGLTQSGHALAALDLPDWQAEQEKDQELP